MTKYGFPEESTKKLVHEEVAAANEGLRKHNKKTLPAHIEKDIVSKFGPKNLKHSQAAFYTKPTKTVKFEVKVHDFVNDKAVHDAKVTYFELIGDDNKFIDPKEYDYKCDINKYRDFFSIKSNF